MSDLELTLARLAALDKQISPSGAQGADDEDPELDEFGRLKKKVARDIQEVRKNIQDRDELFAKQGGGGTTATVTMSAKIRQQLASVRSEAAKMQQMQKEHEHKLEKRGTGDKKGMLKANQELEEVRSRGDIVENVFKHVEECEALEKKRYSRPDSKEERTSLMVGSGGRAGIKAPKNATETSLAPIDEDAAAGLAMLQKQDQQLDETLTVIGLGVQRLGRIAVDMQEEVKTQAVMIQEIDEKVEKATTHLQGLNTKIKDALEKVRPNICSRALFAVRRNWSSLINVHAYFQAGGLGRMLCLILMLIITIGIFAVVAKASPIFIVLPFVTLIILLQLVL
jgi:SYP7 family syntaxin